MANVCTTWQAQVVVKHGGHHACAVDRFRGRAVPSAANPFVTHDHAVEAAHAQLEALQGLSEPGAQQILKYSSISIHDVGKPEPLDEPD